MEIQLGDYKIMRSDERNIVVKRRQEPKEEGTPANYKIIQYHGNLLNAVRGAMNEALADSDVKTLEDIKEVLDNNTNLLKKVLGKQTI